MAIQKRDSDYFKKKLRRRRKDLYDEVLAGRMTVNKARQLAGMGGKRTWISQLKNAWGKASPAERSQFLRWAGLTASSPTPPAPVPSPGGSAFDSDGYMLDWARRRIPEIMQRRSMSSGDVAEELGLKRLDASVMMAVRGDVKVKASTATEVDRWLVKNASV